MQRRMSSVKRSFFTPLPLKSKKRKQIPDATSLPKNEANRIKDRKSTSTTVTNAPEPKASKRTAEEWKTVKNKTKEGSNPKMKIRPRADPNCSDRIVNVVCLYSQEG